MSLCASLVSASESESTIAGTGSIGNVDIVSGL